MTEKPIIKVCFSSENGLIKHAETRMMLFNLGINPFCFFVQYILIGALGLLVITSKD